MAVSAQEDADRQLKKTLGIWQLFFLSMGGIIGSGWLLAVLAADNVAGPAVILSWIVGGILVLFIALTFAEVSGMIPRSGAIVRYPHMTHGGFTGFLLGWGYFLTAVTVPTIEAEATVTYASSYIKGLTNGTVLTPLGIGFAVVLMLIFFVINNLGVRVLGVTNTIVTIWKFVLPILTFLLLFLEFKSSNFTVGGGFFAQGVPAVFEAIPATGIVFSYLGFRQALDFGGEARNPQKDVPRATILSVLAAVAIYTLLQVAFTGAIDWGKAGIPIGAWGKLSASAWAQAPFASEMKASGLALLVAFAVLLNIDAYVSPSGTGLVYTGTSTRTLFGLSIMGYLPRPFQRVSARGVPVIALVASLVIGLLFLLPLPSWYELVGFISSATVLTYVTGGVALTVFRRTASDLHRPFRLPGAPVLAPLAFVAAALIVYWSGTQTLNYVVLAIFVGLPLYAWFYAPARIGVNRVASYVLGVLFLVAIVLTAHIAPHNVAPKDLTDPKMQLSFGVYLLLLVVEVVVYATFMWLMSNAEGRQEIGAGMWLVAMLFGIFLISYYGAFGPLPAASQLPFPVDTIITGLLALACYYWAVSTGFKTKEITAIVEAASASEVVAPPLNPNA